ncbi:MAG: hypothetical protein LUQ18_10060 [Methylococcaceae bacterium]|nr:hypothetical protein [Methylococcaceae bacterium]
MAQIVVCDSVTVIDATHYECVGQHVIEFTGSINPPLDFLHAGGYMTVGFFIMFAGLGLVLPLRILYQQIRRFL